jgi:LysM domain
MTAASVVTNFGSGTRKARSGPRMSRHLLVSGRRRPTQRVSSPSRARRFEQPERKQTPVARPVVVPRPGPMARPVPRARPIRRRPVVISPPTKPAGGLRLTRRGRIIGLLLIAAIGYGAFGLGRASASATGDASSPQTVVVHQGDSLWSIAVRAMPGEDPRDAVASIKSLNRLTSAQVDVGEQLRIR